MKITYLLFFVTISIGGKAQSNLENENNVILEKVELFFQSLEKQDTVLYRNLFMPDAQGWSVRVRNDSILHRNWLNVDRVKSLINPSAIVKESKLSYEIKVHQQIAMAWIPYTLSVNGKFSHCGVDLFTFIKTDLGWKINSCTFTIEPNGCDAILRN